MKPTTVFEELRERGIRGHEAFRLGLAYILTHRRDEALDDWGLRQPLHARPPAIAIRQIRRVPRSRRRRSARRAAKRAGPSDGGSDGPPALPRNTDRPLILEHALAALVASMCLLASCASLRMAHEPGGLHCLQASAVGCSVGHLPDRARDYGCGVGRQPSGVDGARSINASVWRDRRVVNARGPPKAQWSATSTSQNVEEPARIVRVGPSNANAGCTAPGDPMTPSLYHAHVVARNFKIYSAVGCGCSVRP